MFNDQSENCRSCILMGMMLEMELKRGLGVLCEKAKLPMNMLCLISLTSQWIWIKWTQICLQLIQVS